MNSDNIEKLYENYCILADAKNDFSKHEEAYLKILVAVKGSDKEKRLASQLIVIFFNNFPNLSQQALEALFGLCEDDNKNIRKKAIKYLPTLCADHKKHTRRIADVLAQCLKTNDKAERNIITNSLLLLLKIEAKSALTGLFSQIHQNCEIEITMAVVKERCIKFLATKVTQLGREIINEEAEELILAKCRQLVESQDVVAAEFKCITDLLTWSKWGQSYLVKMELELLVTAFAFTPNVYHPRDPEYLEKIRLCAEYAEYLLSVEVHSNEFINFFCDHILTRWDEIPNALEGAADVKFFLLQLFAILLYHCGEVENAQQKIDAVCDMLIKYLPEAPLEHGEKDESEAKPTFKFSHLECVLFSLHSLCRKAPNSLSADVTRYKLLRLRLQYAALLTQGHMKMLEEGNTQGQNEEAVSEGNEFEVASLKTTSNITNFIRDLLRTPSSFKCKVQLSFQPMKSEEEIQNHSNSEEREQSPGQERHRPINFDNEHNNGRFSRSYSFRDGRGGYGRRGLRNNRVLFRRRNNLYI